jgi:hypothetical protein
MDPHLLALIDTPIAGLPMRHKPHNMLVSPMPALLQILHCARAHNYHLVNV